MGRAHSGAYRQVTPFLEPRITPRMRVICGRHAASTERAARQLGWEESETDWRRAIERDDIGIVDICTPGDSHAEIAIAAAQAGKVVFCEKPLANTLDEARAMLDAVQKANVLHMVCHNYRRTPAVLLAKKLIESGRLGDIYHFRGTYLQDWIVDPSFPLVWRLQKEHAGSGALGDIGSHSIDLARFLVGEITSVTAALETFIHERPLPDDPARKGKVTVDDAVASVLRFENGTLGTMEATRFATGRKNANRFEINGSKGSIAFDIERLNELDVYFSYDDADVKGFRTIHVTENEHPFGGKWWPSGHSIGYEHTFTHTVYDLLECIADDRMPSPSFVDGVRNQQVLDAIETAAHERRWIDVA